jgi:hypothetical protein
MDGRINELPAQGLQIQPTAMGVRRGKERFPVGCKSQESQQGRRDLGGRPLPSIAHSDG